MSTERAGTVSSLPPRILQMFIQCRQDKLIGRFSEIVRQMTARPPSDMVKFFIEFLHEARNFTVKPELASQMRAKYGREVAFKKACGIAMVIVAGQIRELMPSKGMELDSTYKETRTKTKDLVVKDATGLALLGCRRHRLSLRRANQSFCQ